MSSLKKFETFYATVLTTLLIIGMLLLGIMNVWADDATLSSSYVIGIVCGVSLIIAVYLTFTAWKNL